jgi:hypothetical protein
LTAETNCKEAVKHDAFILSLLEFRSHIMLVGDSVALC